MFANIIKHISGITVLFGFLILSLVLTSSSLADVYRYVDENGVIHLTNVLMGPRFKVLIKERPDNNFKQGRDLGTYDELIAGAAGKYGVDISLVKAVIKAESNFNHKAVSRKGARGLMQLMPQTAIALGVSDSFHPGDNIDGGIRYLSSLIGLYNGDLLLALAAYNAGEGAVAKYRGIPPYAETRTYVRCVLDHYKRYKKESKTTATVLVKQPQSEESQTYSLHSF
ncbi:MAG: transglycosylase SLT domain-containing protein [Deltaproteobacteria bacterium]|nr:transglycosylase SLT domain-containing protein [Deltaproteobacteria bacterium]